MPVETPTNPNLRSAGPPPAQLSAISGRSPADVFADSGGKPVPDEHAAPHSDFGAELKAAQAKDKGTPNAQRPEAPLEHTEEVQPATQSAPKIPSLPEPVDELDAYRQSMPPNGKSAKNWDKLKSNHAAELKAVQAKYEALETQLKTLQNGGNPEFESIRKERDQYRETLRDVAIERDPQFKQKYDTQTKVAIDAAKAAAGDAGEKLGKLLALPASSLRDDQISKLMEDLPESAKRRINAALMNLDQIDISRNIEIEHARQTFNDKQSALMTERKEREAYQTKQMQTTFEEVKKEWTSKHPFFQPKDGDEKYNSEVQRSIDLASQIYMGQQSPQELAQAAFWAASGERVLRGYMSVLKELQAANATIDKLRGVEPGDGRAGTVNEDMTPEPVVGGIDGMRRFGKGLKEAQMMDAQRKRGGR